MTPKRLIPVFLLALMMSGSLLSAQTVDRSRFVPVEQLVDDLDPLSRSLRVLDPSISEAASDSTVYRLRGDPQGKLYYINRGVVAEYNRSQYGLFKIGKREYTIEQTISPDTIFHLGVPDVTPRQADPVPDSPLLVDRRVDRRIASDSPISPSLVSPATGVHDDWTTYLIVRRAQQQAVLNALDGL